MTDPIEFLRKKRDVIWHKHIFPDAFTWDDERRDDVRWRYDALEYEDGPFAVYSANEDKIVSICEGRDDAIAVARRLANASFSSS